MTSSRRYVFDTNTLISAALFEAGKPGKAFRHALKSGTVLLSQAAFVEALVERSRFADPTEEVQACRDPDDDKFLELAVSESVACIISGDEDLLVLSPFRGISIMRPTEFLEWVEDNE